MVAPGTDPSAIAMNFQGADRRELDAGGDLVLHTGGREVRMQKPAVYQEADGVRQEVEGAFVLRSNGQVAFALGAYDRERPLVHARGRALLLRPPAGGDGVLEHRDDPPWRSRALHIRRTGRWDSGSLSAAWLLRRR
jgi:hypothetical protein